LGVGPKVLKLQCHYLFRAFDITSKLGKDWLGKLLALNKEISQLFFIAIPFVKFEVLCGAHLMSVISILTMQMVSNFYKLYVNA